ncbi:MAG: DUF3489 domain-containing protein [Hyphomicrobiales bacterium]|nr:MAG: DUF3489 domain-containing protein [Hyphomicrobiales bacterium]
MPKLKLTDADRVILCTAAARESGMVLPPAKSLKLSADALGANLRKLVSKSLLNERQSEPGQRVWRTTDDGTKLTLVISAAGFTAIDGSPSETDEPRQDVASTKRPTREKHTGKDVERPSAGKTTKLDMLIAALRHKMGATIDELMEATGWQAHSVRGSISGALKKRMSLNVVSETVDGRGRVYRIEASTTK